MALLASPGCALWDQWSCNYDAERLGIYRGQRYTGNSCSSYTTKGRRGGRDTVTNCYPQFEDVWEWTPESHRYYAACMAEAKAKRAGVARPAPPAPAPAPPPVDGRAGRARAGPGRS